jgi:hypothetical protein
MSKNQYCRTAPKVPPKTTRLKKGVLKFLFCFLSPVFVIAVTIKRLFSIKKVE